MRVSVVDDSVVIRDRLVAMLTTVPDVEVVGVYGSADAALGAIATLQPDLVILDVRLPGTSGMEAIPQIRRLAQSTEIVVFTNFPYDRYRARCLEAGASRFLDKSKDFLELCRLVEQRAASVLP
jgi:DNA-binding NarL/FixJ family response regulator